MDGAVGLTSQPRLMILPLFSALRDQKQSSCDPQTFRLGSKLNVLPLPSSDCSQILPLCFYERFAVPIPIRIRRLISWLIELLIALKIPLIGGWDRVLRREFSAISFRFPLAMLRIRAGSI